jgi:MFS family permease
MPHSSLSDLLRQKSFLRFWCARLTGVMANQMLMVALGWHMYDITGSAWDLGLVGLFQFVPALLMTLPAGHAADRWHRGRIFAACMALQAVVACSLATSAWHGTTSRELILGLSVLLGLARAFQMPAQQAITPLLVPASLVPRAVTLSTGGMEFAVIAGPALGGLIYVAGATAVYACAAVLLGLSTLLALGVRYAQRPAHNAVGWSSMLAGLAFVWKTKVLLGAQSLDLFAVLLGGATALLPIYARDILHTGPEGLGLLRAAPSVGALAMSLVLMRWPLRRRVGRTLLLAVAAFGLATLVFGLSTHLGLSMLALMVAGAADNISVVVRLTILQMDTPDEIRGRVSAVNAIFIGASNQLGEFESGALAAALGPVASVVIGGLGTLLVAALWGHMFPALARRDQLHQPEKTT